VGGKGEEGLSSSHQNIIEGLTTEENASIQSLAKAVQENLKMEESLFQVKLNVVTGDDPFDFIINKPDKLEAIEIHRRRKTNVTEFQNTLKSFKSDTRSLSLANDVASKLAGLAKSAVDGFKGLASRMKFDESTMSMAQIRWKKACHRVVLNNAVKFYRKLLEVQFNRSNEEIKSNKTISRATFPNFQDQERKSTSTFAPNLSSISEPLPKISDCLLDSTANTPTHTPDGKKIVKVLSKYSKNSGLISDNSTGKLPVINNPPTAGTKGRRMTNQ